MKSKIALALLFAFVLAAFNLVYFSVWEHMSTTRWICWGTIHAAFALIVAAAHSTKAAGDGLVHSYPKMAVACSLFLITVVAGIVLTIWNPESWKVPVVVLSILGFGDLFTYISLMSAEEATAADERCDARRKRFVQVCAERLAEARTAQSDPALLKQIEKAFDAIRGAQIATVPAVAAIETEIVSLVSELCEAAQAGSAEIVSTTASKVVAAVRKRDMEIRLAR